MDAGCLGGRLTTTNTFDPLFHTADASPHALGIVPVDRCHSLQAFGSVWFDEGVAVVAFTHARWRTLACCCCLGVGDRGGGGGVVFTRYAQCLPMYTSKGCTSAWLRQCCQERSPHSRPPLQPATTPPCQPPSGELRWTYIPATQCEGFHFRPPPASLPFDWYPTKPHPNTTGPGRLAVNYDAPKPQSESA